MSVARLRDYKPSVNGTAPWPDELETEAFHGPAGEFVVRVSPHSESDRAALLLQYLTTAGNLMGPDAYVMAEGDRHPARLFTALVGDSSKGRKGTSKSRVHQVVDKVDPAWADRIGGGLGSGEGPLAAVADQTVKLVAEKKGGRATGEFFEEVTDPGVTDKRLLIIETELARHFDVMNRQGNTLSETIRRFWDGGTVRSMTRNSPLKATNPHVSLVGHITRDELLRKMTDTESANGWGNRILWAAVRRRGRLPFGGALPHEDILIMQKALGDAVREVRGWGERCLTWQPDAADRWVDAYNGELDVERPGMLGAITARSEAQALRLAVGYALLDASPVIEAAHLEAALAVWKFCAASAEWAFGGQLGLPLADSILAALRRAGRRGMNRTEIHACMGRNKSADELDSALTALVTSDLAVVAYEQTGGAPAQRWFAKETT